jgi:alpha-amylase
MGEVFELDGSHESIAKRTGQYTKAMTSVLNFSLYRAIAQEIFTSGASVLSDVKRQQFDHGRYHDPYVLGNFIDNHDVPRFLGRHNNNWDQLKESLTLIYVWPGIPIVYYGTEQAHNDGGRGDPYNRPNLWDLGYHQDHPIYQHITRLSKLRHGSSSAGSAIRKGKMVERWTNGHLYAFERGENLLVMMNSSGNDGVMTNLRTALKSGIHRELLYGTKTITVDQSGMIPHYILKPYEILLFGNDS